MNPPSGAQVEKARQLLSHEANSGRAGETAAARVYDKLEGRLSPLLGTTGVQLLFARSAKLVKIPPEKLRERLAARDPAVSPDEAIALFASFLTLITTFIGDRLTAQVLRSAWPALEAQPPVEKKNE